MPVAARPAPRRHVVHGLTQCRPCPTRRDPDAWQVHSGPGLFSAMQPTSDSLHLGNYLGALVQLGRAAGDPRRHLLRRRPARDHRRARPGGAARAHPPHGGAVPRRRRRPGALGAVRAEPRARARRAGLGARLPHRLRRGRPDDAVQGQGPEAGQRPGPPSGCSPTRCCRRPTSSSTTPTPCRSARTSASTSS